MDISKIDKNFTNSFNLEGMKMYNVNEEPFKLYGLYRESGETDFKRLPQDVAMATDNNSVKALYTNTLPFLVYGSSITQGACASHPENSYPAMLSREFDTDFINLGFSGSCKGEMCLAEHIQKFLKVCLFMIMIQMLLL